jgi:LPXTG-motif cell wall-anchored protein
LRGIHFLFDVDDAVVQHQAHGRTEAMSSDGGGNRVDPNEGATMRHPGRHAPAGLEKERPAEGRWRRTLAAVAISALALGGISTMAAAPAFADDALTAEGETSIAETASVDAATGTDGGAEADVTESESEADAAEAPAVAEVPASAPAPADVSAPADAPDPADPRADTAPAPPAADGATAAAAAADVSVEASGPVVFLVPPDPTVPVEKVEICHATSSYQNPYVINEPNANGDVSGHADHTGPIFTPDIPKGTQWGDIIPPFSYETPEGVESFPGLNWTAEGQAIYEDDCLIPTPEPVLTITPAPCILYGPNGELQVSLGPLQSNVDYRLTIFDSEDALVTELLLSGVSGTFEDSFEFLPPGDYSITLEQSIIEDVWDLLDEQFFTIGECPELDVMVTPGPCVIGDEGTATVTFTGLIEGESYSYFIEGTDFFTSDTFESLGESSEVVVEGLPPGNFIVYIEWEGEDPEFPVFDWAGFVIEPCQPEIIVEVTECPAPGGTGSALLRLSSLVDGIEYEVKVTDRGAAGGTSYGGVHVVTGDAAGNAQLLISGLPAGHEFTAWIDGVFVAPPWEEPPFVGGGGFTPIDTVEFHASVDFALKPCPGAPVVPEKPVTPAKVVPVKALPKTGTSGVGELLLGSMLLLGLGGAALVAARRRQTGDHVS